MPYMAGSGNGSETLGDVASNRAAYANIKGVASVRPVNMAERHREGAVSSGPMAAVQRPDTGLVTRVANRTAALSNGIVYDKHGTANRGNQSGYVVGGDVVTRRSFSSMGGRSPVGRGSYVNDAAPRIGPGEMLVANDVPFPVLRRSNVSLQADGTMGEYLGFSLGKVVKNIGNTVKKAVVDTGHVAGKVVTSKIGQGVLGTALAVTGVGAPAAAGIFAATKGVGNLIKPGGNLKSAATGAAQGAVEGVVAAGAGKLVRAGISKITQSHASGGAEAVAAAVATPIVASQLPPGLDPSNIPGISITPSAQPPLFIPPPQIATLPSNDGQIPQIGQQAPAYPRSKRVKASADVNTKVGAAKRVLAAGANAKKGADDTANKIDALSSKLDAVAEAAAAAKALGDKTGADSLSQMAAALQSQIQNAQNVAGGASSDLRTAGNIAEGAATGAVGGAGISSLSDFINNNKALVYGGGAALALVITMAVMHQPSGGGGSRTVYRSRPRARAR
jgi:hypothetical protein